MNEQQILDYKRIEKAINHIKDHYTEQPDLDKLADIVSLSPFHFQRLFTEWAGVSPKKFLQYTTLQHAKSLLKTQQATLFDVAHQTGLSSTSRLHELFVNIEAMSPLQYKSAGHSIEIRYSFQATPFGEVLVASTAIGICYMMFVEDLDEGLAAFKAYFNEAKLVPSDEIIHQQAVAFFTINNEIKKPLNLHLKGTSFQLKVWESLLKIPLGALSTYGQIASSIGQPSASRAVGTAIGSNPVAYMIPCHRVIQASGNLGGYMWGTTRKTAIIAWESAKLAI